MIGAHLRGNAVAYVALFFALTGSAAALSRGEVKQRHISSGAVTTPKLAGNAVKPAKVATGAVRPRHIAAGAVGNVKLADGSVDADKIAGQSIGAGQIADGAIDLDKVHRPSFLTREAGRQLRFYAREMNTQASGSWEFGRVTIHQVAVNQIQVCPKFFAGWGYGISIDGSFQHVGSLPPDGCGPTHTLTTGGQFQINAGQDLIFGSGDSSTAGYYFAYGLYSP